MKQQVSSGLPLDAEKFDASAITDNSPIGPALRSFLSNDADQHLKVIEQLFLGGDLSGAQDVARELLQRLDIHPNVLFTALTILPPHEVPPAVKYLWSSAEHLRIPLLLSLNNTFGQNRTKLKEIIDPLIDDQARADPALFHLAAKLTQA